MAQKWESDPRSLSLDAYEKMADDYYLHGEERPFNGDYERPATTSLIPDVTGSVVLDCGCAAGWYSAWLLAHGAARVISADQSARMLEMTSRSTGGQAETVRADLNRPLDFLSTGELDGIVSSLTLHYIEDWRPLMAEFRRVLKPGGWLVFSVHHPFMDFMYFHRDNYFAIDKLIDTWKTTIGPVQVQFYRRPLSAICAPVLEQGFVLERLEEPMPLPSFCDKDPAGYEKLQRCPQFLFFRFRKGIR